MRGGLAAGSAANPPPATDPSLTCIPHLQRARHVGSYDSEEGAALAYDAEAFRVLGPGARLNFPPPTSPGGRPRAPTPPRQAPAAGGRGSSRFRGVSRHERSGRWEVRVWGGGRQNFCGSFMHEADAARAYDRAVVRMRGNDARFR